MLVLDHIALSAGSLEQGNAAFEAATGLRLPQGGVHPMMSTHNLLSALGPDTFLELIATDPQVAAPDRARWFGLDDQPGNAPLHTHALLYRTDDIDGDLARAHAMGIDLGQALALSRGDLSWRISVRDDGCIPLSGTAPMLLQWDTPGPHPAGRMTDQGLRLGKISVQTPDPDRLSKLFDAWTLPPAARPEITEGPAHMTVTLILPDGREVAL